MHKLGRKLTSALLTLALLVSLLPIGAAPAQAADTPHDISQGTLTITQDGNYTVTGTTPVNNIVVEEDVTATVTLNNVNITAQATMVMVLAHRLQVPSICLQEQH